MAVTSSSTADTPKRINALFIGLVIYVALCAAWMLTGLGGPQITHYVGLLSDAPAALVGVIIAVATARHVAAVLRTAWWLLAERPWRCISWRRHRGVSWLFGTTGFGPADVFYFTFYPTIAAAALFLIGGCRARALGAFVPRRGNLQRRLRRFFLVPGDSPGDLHTHVVFLKEALSQAYVILDCGVLLMFGVLLLAGAGSAGGRRVPLLILSGLAAMFSRRTFSASAEGPWLLSARADSRTC